MVPFGNNSHFSCRQPAVPGRHALPITFTVAKPLRIGSGTGHLPPDILCRVVAGRDRPARVFWERCKSWDSDAFRREFQSGMGLLGRSAKLGAKNAGKQNAGKQAKKNIPPK